MASKKVDTANTEKWYEDAQQYWKTIPATVDGMLGGLAYVSPSDIEESKNFLNHFLKSPDTLVKADQALDCGCGIGRITKHLLLPTFKTVDMVEQNQEFLNQASAYLGEENFKRVGNVVCCGLQDFTPEKSCYNVIWAQWVLAHLIDDHLVQFLKRCQSGLTDNGLIIIKENISPKECEIDDNDSSITRTDQKYKSLFKEAGLRILKQCSQKNFPKELFKVKMYALSS